MSDTIVLYENGKAVGGEGHPTNANEITFDNEGTNLVSEEVESAIKEVNAKLVVKAEKTDIAPVESSSTASASHATGSQFYFNGQLVTATANISIGGTIVLNGNCVPSSNLTDQIDSMTAQYFDASAYKTSYISSMSGCILKIGRAVFIQVWWSGNITGNEAIMVIPQALRPGSNRTGGGTARMASGVENAEYYVAATNGHIAQNLTSNSVTNGSFTIAYTI